MDAQVRREEPKGDPVATPDENVAEGDKPATIPDPTQDLTRMMGQTHLDAAPSTEETYQMPQLIKFLSQQWIHASENGDQAEERIYLLQEMQCVPENREQLRTQAKFLAGERLKSSKDREELEKKGCSTEADAARAITERYSP